MALHPRKFYSELPSVISLNFLPVVLKHSINLVTYFSTFFNHVLVFLIIIYVWKTGRKTYGNKVTGLSLCIQARRQAETQLKAEWQEMINAMDQQALLQERELMRKQR
jgi:hypothetical protein